MNETIPKFLRRKDDSLFFNTDGEFAFYVPEKYFETKNAVITGEYVLVLGILDYVIFDKAGKPGKLKPFNFPTSFLTKPYTIEKIKDVKLTEFSNKTDYRILKYKKDDMIVVSTKVPKDVVNVESFFNLLIGANLSNTIPYDKIQDYIVECGRLNGVNYGITIQLLGVIVSGICRSKYDENKLFRLTDMKSMTDYNFINVRRIPKLNGAFSSIISENWNDALINAIMSDTSKDTPMEKILMP